MAEGTSLDAPIAAVTVFRDGARVQRTGTVNVEPGLRPVVIGGLPASVDPASVRVAARGAGLALLDVEAPHRFRTDPLREETGRLRSDVERYRDLVQELDDEDQAEQARLTFLGHLSESAATAPARARSVGRADHQARPRMAAHLPADTGGSLSRRREIGVRKRAARRELEAAEQRLAAAEGRAGGAVPLTEVSVILEASAATTAEIDISYHVDGASWRPLYDLTLDGERLAVSYLAEVRQETGEDWPATELVLSTTRRGRHQSLPELRPWYIGRARPVPARPVMRRSMAMAAAAGAEGAPRTAPAMPMAAAAISPGNPPPPPPGAAHLPAGPGGAGAGGDNRG